MVNKLNKLFNIELLKRILSLIIFIPLMILPIFFSNYLLVAVYLLFNSIILYEILFMRSFVKNKIIFNCAIVLTSYTFFYFIFINITKSVSISNIIEIIATIWLFDTFSYLGGKIIGGKKLIPSISAGKTISGLIIGILTTFFTVQVTYIYIDQFSFISMLFTLQVILFAFVGDLIASILKRFSVIKDSGRIMPGHGGLLDRLDSFIGVFFASSIIYIIV